MQKVPDVHVCTSMKLVYRVSTVPPCAARCLCRAPMQGGEESVQSRARHPAAMNNGNDGPRPAGHRVPLGTTAGTSEPPGYGRPPTPTPTADRCQGQYTACIVYGPRHDLNTGTDRPRHPATQCLTLSTETTDPRYPSAPGTMAGPIKESAYCGSRGYRRSVRYPNGQCSRYSLWL